MTRSELPFGLVWLLPSGRVALWLLSTSSLALLVTILPPFPTDEAWLWQLVLLLYVLGGTLSESDQLREAIVAILDVGVILAHDVRRDDGNKQTDDDLSRRPIVDEYQQARER